MSKKLKNVSPKAYQLFRDECKLLSKIKNENVVGFVDYLESDSTCYLILEYCNEGDLDGYLKKKKKLTEEEAIPFFKPLLNGFKALHEHNIIHRE